MNPHEILQPNVNLSHRFKSALLYTFGVSCDVVFCGVPKPIYCKYRPVGCNHRSVSSFSDALSNSRALIRKKNGRVSLRKTAKKEKLRILGQFFYYPCLSYHFSYTLLEGITPMANLQRIFLFFVSDGLQRHSIYFWCSARCSFSSSSRSAPKGQR